MKVSPKKIELVVFDWAGTAVDHGCFAPVAPFIDTFAAFDVEIDVEQARRPMGLHKKDHIRELLRMPEVAERWKTAQGRDWAEDDVETLFTDYFVPKQMDAIQKHSRVVPGLLDCVALLRQQGVKIGTSTGFFRQAAEVVYAAARDQGYEPDNNVCTEDVPDGRPAPWMIYRNMEATGVYPTASVVKSGDTVPDIEEGLNAGVWTVGVTHTGSDVGCSVAELGQLRSEKRMAKVLAASTALHEAGAHWVIQSVADLPSLLPAIEKRLADGQKP